jgi:hypothetical protein
MSRSILRVVVEDGEPLVLGNAMMDPRFADAKSVLAYNLRSAHYLAMSHSFLVLNSYFSPISDLHLLKSMTFD